MCLGILQEGNTKVSRILNVNVTNVFIPLFLYRGHGEKGDGHVDGRRLWMAIYVV